ncbi:HNH endonuclease [Labrys sp. WJW]|uniref:HNH endonuclease n=1 Tax=Labrys sp. WJW TaxID=1737983 RepID=UPI0013906BFE
MSSQNIQGLKVPVQGGGVCIYCGSSGGADGLKSEHIVPYSLGGNTELTNASCRDCEGITSYLDGYLANATYKHLRVHAKVQSRRGHPSTLPAFVELPNGSAQLDLAPPDHPYFLHMPVWPPPGLMRGAPLSSEFPPAKAHVFWWFPPSIGEKIGLQKGQIGGIEDRTPMPNLTTFARAIAKIAYCHGVFLYGLNGFRSLALPDIILGRYPCISYFVGSDMRDPPQPDPPGRLHTIVATTVTVGALRYLTLRIRLFAHSGTPENGMPTYEVVIGAEGPCRVRSLRPSPKLARTILL